LGHFNPAKNFGWFGKPGAKVAIGVPGFKHRPVFLNIF